VSGPGRRFDPSELRTAGEPEPSVAELADALLAARELESVTTEGIHPTEGFGDRVMAAVALEPAPRLVVRPGATVRGGRAGAFLIAVRDAWGVATTGGRPVAVRAQALAFILLVVVATGTLTSAAAIGVGGLLGPDRGSAPTFDPDSTAPTSPVGPTQATDGQSAEPSETPGEIQSAEPSETPEATETPVPGKTPTTGTSRPTATPRATETSEPTDATEPTETPKATETPRATGGSSGSGGGGGDSPGHG
jgi:hypothetical protein